ncbi:RNA polymerase sigma factor [Bythopirellula polymerisocia]|uniref:ECF RNA polymerase sigma-E factor n=1 Tax=Bythopirellula polymerisocia TaxID=2528003 RepID=A0A5C6CWY2_9BACT|nr:RNA polymerase sigma factor [Bythopirellula polymerisocia]TWU27526.1 ECF RNA polymerase sigma-E factor [Bythopirellula polymerisocia]
MHNPFSEATDDDSDDLELVCQANSGDRDSLERLVLRHQAWIYNIAVRMVFDPQDAEEVTQEVLIKAVTRLSTFRGDSKFRTWLYRITANHILNMKRRGAEATPYTFSTYADAINGTPDLDLPDPKSVPVDVPLLVEETKVACTTGMLLCLDRRQRLIFTLGEIIGASDTVGGEVMDMTADNFRQCLARARRDLYQFMNHQCGLVNASNPCRCPKKTKGFIDAGHVDPHRLLFAAPYVQRIRDAAVGTIREIDDVADRSFAAIYRDHPFLEPTEQAQWLRRILDLPEVRATLRLN